MGNLLPTLEDSRFRIWHSPRSENISSQTVAPTSLISSFVIDGSGSMKNDVAAVREHLNAMTDLFDRANMDFTIGIVTFPSWHGIRFTRL